MTPLSTRTHERLRMRPVLMLVFLVAVNVMPTVTVYGATFVIEAGNGFDDPEPREPVGGNNGTTLGQQRLNVFNLAASLWGKLLQSSVNIVVDASFDDNLACDATSAILGGATSSQAFADFPAAPRSNTWYPAALADALSGRDIDPGISAILAKFNVHIEGDPTCLGGRRWYYGFDHNPGVNVDFLNVIMHEIAHGLGFESFTNETTGAFTGGMPGIYDVFIRDLTQGVTWAEMASDALRRTSAINTGKVVWDGPLVNAQTSFLSKGLGPNGAVLLYAPNPVESGSSISHWDTSLTPDTLMEPFITANLRASDGVDLTTCLLADIGWTLNLTGSCLHLPDIFLATNAIHFGNQVLDTPKNETLVISNNGSVDLKLGSVAMTNGLMPPFALSSDNCTNQTLTGGATCSLVVQFLPLTEGSFSDSFDIPSNDADTPSAVITLTGSGVTTIVSTDSGGGGGGCTLTHRNEFDPLFGLLLLAAGLHFARALIKHIHKPSVTPRIV